MKTLTSASSMLLAREVKQFGEGVLVLEVDTRSKAATAEGRKGDRAPGATIPGAEKNA
jgi:hypothetical protein